MQGLIVINKPKDITSFQVVAAVRRLTGVKRVGHAGTLDPIAEGVLPVLIGRPCVLSNYLTGGDKTYIAGVKLGITSDTYDITGTLSEGKEVSVTDGQLKAAFLAFTGSIMQVPPMYSAKKVDGKKLYELARSGRTIERRACPVRRYEYVLIPALHGDEAKALLMLGISAGQQSVTARMRKQILISLFLLLSALFSPRDLLMVSAAA